ncbi:hypothetical protein N9Y60_05485, partial [Crocinitomicaceae bacterium]|nr:hypothetical protein [Crocinitomicaceae bacterium]
MKFVNRGYIIVRPKEAFIVWANENDADYSNLEDNEPNVYLIEEDFYDDEAVLKGYFKRIFENELYAVTDQDTKFPPIKYEVFTEW